METIVLKIGGSLVTKKSSDRPEIDAANLSRICREIGEAYNSIKTDKRLFIVHGAGSYGHIIAKNTGIDKGISSEVQLVDFAETQRLQNELNCAVTKELIKNGVPAFPFQCSSHSIMENGRLVSMSHEAAAKLVSIGMVPVAFGVPSYDETRKSSILSGDEIAPFFARKLGAKLVIHATDVDGVFTADPKIERNAKLIEEINSSNINEVKKYLSGSVSTDVTGGMSNKISKLVSLGIKTAIINGANKDKIRNALTGKIDGTVITT